MVDKKKIIGAWEGRRLGVTTEWEGRQKRHRGGRGVGGASLLRETGVRTARDQRHRGRYATWEGRGRGVRSVTAAWEGRERGVIAACEGRQHGVGDVIAA